MSDSGLLNSSTLRFNAASVEHFRALLEHPSAPRFNFESSDLLDRSTLQDVHRFASEVLARPFWAEGQLPDWMPGFLQAQFESVPFYRSLGGRPASFETIPTVSREHFSLGVERFVPDHVNFDDITVYTTSGTSGSSLSIPTDAAVTSKVLALMDNLLSEQGARLPRGPGAVAVAAVFSQEETLTYASLSHYLQGAATLKLNLHPAAWNCDGDPARYLLEANPSVVSGCPRSLRHLAQVVPGLRPLAVFSSAEALEEELQEQLGEVFACPVYDVYGMTEAKFISARGRGDEHLLLSPDLYVEILNPEGRPVAAGELGEVTLSGGRNRCLPLLRYRTGDLARLTFRGSRPLLYDFRGRAPVGLRDGKGGSISSLDVIAGLRKLPLIGFSFEQFEDLSYRFSYCGEVESSVVTGLLKERLGLNGKASKITSWSGKQHLFRTSDHGES